MVGGSLQRTCSSIFRSSIDVPPPLPVGTWGRGRGKGGPKRDKRSRKARQQEEEKHQEEEEEEEHQVEQPTRRSMCRRHLRRVVGAKRGRRRMTQQVVTLVVPFGSEVARDSRIGRYLFRDDHWLNPVANGKYLSRLLIFCPLRTWNHNRD
jgi:hypothetical protein